MLEILERSIEKSPINPEIELGGYKYYSVDQVARILGVQKYHIVNIVRDPESGLNGRKIGPVYVIDANQFNEWVKTGKFDKQEYTVTDKVKTRRNRYSEV